MCECPVCTDDEVIWDRLLCHTDEGVGYKELMTR